MRTAGGYSPRQAPPHGMSPVAKALAEEWETTHRMTSVRPGVRKQWPGECGREERQHRAEDQEPDCVGEEPKRGLQIIIPATYFAPDDGAQPIQIAGSQEHPLLTDCHQIPAGAIGLIEGKGVWLIAGTVAQADEAG